MALNLKQFDEEQFIEEILYKSQFDAHNSDLINLVFALKKYEGTNIVIECCTTSLKTKHTIDRYEFHISPNNELLICDTTQENLFSIVDSNISFKRLYEKFPEIYFEIEMGKETISFYIK